MLTLLKLSTDGAYRASTGQGGWAVVFYPPLELDCPCGTQAPIESKAGEVRRSDDPTNQRMEMQAVIEGLKLVSEHTNIRQVLVESDSQYVIYTMTKGWRRRANQDLWNELDEQAYLLDVVFRWCPRNSTPGLDRADELAKKMTK